MAKYKCNYCQKYFHGAGGEPCPYCGKINAEPELVPGVAPDQEVVETPEPEEVDPIEEADLPTRPWTPEA